jgi:predicted adenylyl cyclase CyaB
MLEIEAKLYLGTESAAREVCRKLDLPWLDGTFEKNRIYDFPDGRLARRGALVRIRERGESGFLTYKEKSAEKVEGAKVRLEYDTAVSDPLSAIQLLTSLGLLETLTYERFRARHRLGETHLEIDCMPGGWFCEIEGSPPEIARLRECAGLSQYTPLAWSYPEIFTRLTGSVASGSCHWTFEAERAGTLILPPLGDPFWERASREPG